MKGSRSSFERVRKVVLDDATIAVTGLDARDNPHPGVPVAKCLREGRFKGRLIGLTYDALCSGAYRADLFDEVYLTPLPSENEHLLLSRLLEISGETPVDLVIPTLDSEIAAYARLARSLAKGGIRTYLPSETSVKRRGKAALADFCRASGIDHPRTELLSDIKQVRHCLERFALPVVIKGSIVDARVARSPAEGEQHYRDILELWGYPVLLQEWLQGEELNVTLLRDREGRMIGSVVMKKTGITEKGKGFAGATVHNAELVRLGEYISEKLNWVGGMELEILKEASTGRYYLLEVNARFPAWIWLAALAGQNLPMALAELAFGKRVEPFGDYAVGQMFFRNAHTTICDVSALGAFVMRNRD